MFVTKIFCALLLLSSLQSILSQPRKGNDNLASWENLPRFESRRQSARIEPDTWNDSPNNNNEQPSSSDDLSNFGDDDTSGSRPVSDNQGQNGDASRSQFGGSNRPIQGPNRVEVIYADDQDAKTDNGNDGSASNAQQRPNIVRIFRPRPQAVNLAPAPYVVPIAPQPIAVPFNNGLFPLAPQPITKTVFTPLETVPVQSSDDTSSTVNGKTGSVKSDSRPFSAEKVTIITERPLPSPPTPVRSNVFLLPSDPNLRLPEANLVRENGESSNAASKPILTKVNGGEKGSASNAADSLGLPRLPTKTIIATPAQPAPQLVRVGPSKVNPASTLVRIENDGSSSDQVKGVKSSAASNSKSNVPFPRLRVITTQRPQTTSNDDYADDGEAASGQVSGIKTAVASNLQSGIKSQLVTRRPVLIQVTPSDSERASSGQISGVKTSAQNSESKGSQRILTSGLPSLVRITPAPLNDQSAIGSQVQIGEVKTSSFSSNNPSKVAPARVRLVTPQPTQAPRVEILRVAPAPVLRPVQDDNDYDDENANQPAPAQISGVKTVGTKSASQGQLSLVRVQPTQRPVAIVSGVKTGSSDQSARVVPRLVTQAPVRIVQQYREEALPRPTRVEIRRLQTPQKPVQVFQENIAPVQVKLAPTSQTLPVVQVKEKLVVPSQPTVQIFETNRVAQPAEPQIVQVRQQVKATSRPLVQIREEPLPALEPTDLIRQPALPQRPVQTVQIREQVRPAAIEFPLPAPAPRLVQVTQVREQPRPVIDLPLPVPAPRPITFVQQPVPVQPTFQVRENSASTGQTQAQTVQIKEQAKPTQVTQIKENPLPVFQRFDQSQQVVNIPASQPVQIIQVREQAKPIEALPTPQPAQPVQLVQIRESTPTQRPIVQNVQTVQIRDTEISQPNNQVNQVRENPLPSFRPFEVTQKPTQRPVQVVQVTENVRPASVLPPTPRPVVQVQQQIVQVRDNQAPQQIQLVQAQPQQIPRPIQIQFQEQPRPLVQIQQRQQQPLIQINPFRNPLPFFQPFDFRQQNPFQFVQNPQQFFQIQPNVQRFVQPSQVEANPAQLQPAPRPEQPRPTIQISQAQQNFLPTFQPTLNRQPQPQQVQLVQVREQSRPVEVSPTLKPVQAIQITEQVRATERPTEIVQIRDTGASAAQQPAQPSVQIIQREVQSRPVFQFQELLPPTPPSVEILRLREPSQQQLPATNGRPLLIPRQRPLVPATLPSPRPVIQVVQQRELAQPVAVNVVQQQQQQQQQAQAQELSPTQEQITQERKTVELAPVTRRPVSIARLAQERLQTARPSVQSTQDEQIQQILIAARA